MLADMALIDDPVEIFEDRRAVGDRLFMLPWFEDKAQRVHVAVRADAGITEQIPCPAQIVAAFDQRETAVGAVLLQVDGHADARNPCTDDQYIDVGILLLGARYLGDSIHPDSPGFSVIDRSLMTGL